MTQLRGRSPVYPIHKVSNSDTGGGTGSPSYPGTGPGLTPKTYDARGITLHKGTSTILAPVNMLQSAFATDASKWLGGYITSQADPETTLWDNWHDHVGIRSELSGMEIVGTEFYNVGDGIVFATGDDWKVNSVKMTHVHDDAVENDNLLNGYIHHSLFDGVHVFLSNADYNSNDDGTGNTILIENCLVRLKPFAESFDPGAWWGNGNHGGFFKESAGSVGGWNQGRRPQVIVRNCIFRSDETAPYGGLVWPTATGGASQYHYSLGLPENSVCENVMLIGTAAWNALSLGMWTSQATGIRYGTTAHWNYHAGLWKPGYEPNLDAVP
jgi:hypothetical protein